MLISVVTPPLEQLIARMNRTRKHNAFVKRFGKSAKAKDFVNAIEKLNKIHKTEFYLEQNGLAFIVQGHREYGHMSRRNGILGQDIDFTLGVHEIEKAGTENTIKIIVDNAGNFLVVSLSKLLENGAFKKEMLNGKFRIKEDKSIPYVAWTLEELRHLDAIMYTG